MSENFGLKIGLEGEKEFKKSLAEINNSFKVLGSEMKLVDSQFDKNDKSTEALTARSEVLNKEIDSQKQKIETLRSALALEIIKSGENYGRYRMRFSAPTYGNSYLYSYANLIKTDGLNLPLYILPYYPYSSGSQHFFGFALGICKLCLTTINNLSEPVRKLDGQVMIITYDIVDE